MQREIIWTFALALCGVQIAHSSEGERGDSIPQKKLSSQVLRDSAPLPSAGMVALSYANVVDRTRDSVVTILVKRQRPSDSRYPDREGEQESEPRRFDLYSPDERDNETDENNRGGGSGVILTGTGFVATNAHVVRDAEKVAVRLREQEGEIAASIIGIDTATDIALLRIDHGGLQPATLGNSGKVRPGDVVLALGSPFGLEQTITFGIISATGRGALGIIEGGMEDFIQTDAAINPGNSGGPLVDGMGRVVGINTARYRGDNIGFAVPVNLMLKVAEDLLEYGWVVRGYLGVQIQEVTPKLVDALNLPKRRRGVIISAVEADQPGAKAGFLPGDLIVEVNGRKVESCPRFQLALAGQQPGSSASFRISRHGEEAVLTAVLADPPELAKVRALEKEQATASEWAPGLFVAEVSREWRLRLQLPPGIGGLVITQPYQAKGHSVQLAAGDQIVAINGIPVKTQAGAKAQLEMVNTPVLLLKVSSGGKERFVAVPRKA